MDEQTKFRFALFFYKLMCKQLHFEYRILWYSTSAGEMFNNMPLWRAESIILYAPVVSCDVTLYKH